MVVGVFHTLGGLQLRQAQLAAAADHLCLAGVGVGGNGAGIVHQNRVEVKHGAEPALAVVALPDVEHAVIGGEVAAHQLGLGALGAAVRKLAVRKAQHAQLRQNQLALAEQHPAGQRQHKQLKRKARLAAGRSKNRCRAVGLTLDRDLRQQRHRQTPQRQNEPADVIAVNVTVVIGQLLGLKGLEDKAVAQRQHEVVAQKADAGQRTDDRDACLEPPRRRSQDRHGKHDGNQRDHIAALPDHAQLAVTRPELVAHVGHRSAELCLTLGVKALHRLPQQNFNAVDHDGGQRGARLADAGITGAAADEPADIAHIPQIVNCHRRSKAGNAEPGAGEQTGLEIAVVGKQPLVHSHQPRRHQRQYKRIGLDVGRQRQNRQHGPLGG